MEGSGGTAGGFLDTSHLVLPQGHSNMKPCR